MSWYSRTPSMCSWQRGTTSYFQWCNSWTSHRASMFADSSSTHLQSHHSFWCQAVQGCTRTGSSQWATTSSCTGAVPWTHCSSVWLHTGCCTVCNSGWSWILVHCYATVHTPGCQCRFGSLNWHTVGLGGSHMTHSRDSHSKSWNHCT